MPIPEGGMEGVCNTRDSWRYSLPDSCTRQLLGSCLLASATSLHVEQLLHNLYHNLPIIIAGCSLGFPRSAWTCVGLVTSRKVSVLSGSFSKNRTWHTFWYRLQYTTQHCSKSRRVMGMRGGVKLCNRHPFITSSLAAIRIRNGLGWWSDYRLRWRLRITPIWI